MVCHVARVRNPAFPVTRPRPAGHRPDAHRRLHLPPGCAAAPPFRRRSNGGTPMTLRTNFQSWMEERAPDVDRMLKKHVTEYYAPKNFNFWYYFGTCSLVVLVNQIVTGIFLA